MLRIFFIVVMLLVLILGASVGYFNAQPVSFNFLFGKWELPLIGLLLGVFVAGVLLTLALMFLRLFTLRAEIGRLRKQLRDTEAELKNLRNLPLPAER